MSEILLDRKQQILLVAQNLFKTKGYGASSMRDIAKEVGVEAASLYNHFSSKEDLLREICFDMAEQFFDEIAPLEKKKFSAKQKLEKAIENHVSVIVKNIDASSVFFHEWKHLSEPHLSDFKTLRNKYEKKFTQIINEGAEQKVFRNVDLKIVTFTIFSALNATYDLYKPNGKLNAKDISKKLSDIIINGLK
jgi:AcrR family transcriptional regulator